MTTLNTNALKTVDLPIKAYGHDKAFKSYKTDNSQIKTNVLIYTKYNFFLS